VINKAKRSYANARVVEILKPGDGRIDPVAGHPGAAWQVLTYGRQLETKQAQVEEALSRIGGLDGFTLEPIVPAAEQWRYRNKLEYSFGGSPGEALRCGFHAPGRWDEIVDIRDCLLASAAANGARDRIVSWCRAQRLEPYDRRTGGGLLRNLVVREGRHTGDLQIRLVTSDGELDRQGLASAGAGLAGVLWTRISSPAEVTQGGETELVAGSEWLEEELLGLRFRMSAEAFFQTNTEMAQRLFQIAIEYANPSGFDRLYDLYCGIGTIGLLMAPRSGGVLGLEVAPEAVADAIANARANEIDNARFYAGDVRLALRELVARAGRPDFIVIDPPRAGLSKKVVRRIVEASPSRIVYVSCNPTTLAPNAAQLQEAGYKLTRVRPVDMFPQTPHIEAVALLEKRG
jgi:23S rRNA (uracil1939-C5)-methyltransferase